MTPTIPGPARPAPMPVSGVFITSDAELPAAGPAPYFRRAFDTPSRPGRATLRVTAIGVVEPYLNGVRVGDEVLAPGWTSYRHRLVVSSYDVTELVTAGSNVVGAIVGAGWAVGRLGYEGKSHHYADRPALFLELELDHEDRTEIIASGPEFTTATGAVLTNSLYDGESWDARLEPRGWCAPGFDAADWQPVLEFDWDTSVLTEQIAPPIRRIEELAPVSVTPRPGGRYVVDFGRILSGWTRMKVDGPAGTTVTLRHAELLRGDEIDPTTLRTALATDRYTLRGEGPETWEPRFTFHGFRYVEVDGWPGELAPDALAAVVLHSDMTRTGWLDTSDGRVNQLHSNVLWSMRGNFVGVPTDCPQRDERLGWTGDLHAFVPVAAFLYDVRGVLGSWLADLAAEQAEQGAVPFVVPDVLDTPSPPTALWGDAAVGVPWTLYREYGDVEILRRAYPSMTAYVRDIAGRLDRNALWSTGFQYGDWLDPDAPEDRPSEGKTDRHLVAQAYFCRATAQLAQSSEILGRTADAAEFTAIAHRVRAAFRHEYVTASGRVVNETATAYALAIMFDLLDPGQLAAAGKRLADITARNGFRISTGFAGTPHVLPALTKTGHVEEAYLTLMQTELPSFLYPVTMGATTIWERWDAIRPDGTLHPSGMTSLNHYAYGAVADWLHRVVGGLEAIEPGYRRVRVAPVPGGGLTHATLTHDTVHGRIDVSWRLAEDNMTVDVVLPPGVEATVVLPADPAGRVLTVAAGRHHWEYELPVTRANPVHTMDTPLRVLADDLRVWRTLTEVFAEHLPGIPIEGKAPEAAALSLNTLLEYVPQASERFRADLEDALGREL
ncbi:glycoside hydrolase family 78 protein [Nocardia sp. NPDC058499]|uniref:glycoside hydrolase family 78 protein n=1 Tax=Nocardia sp. NPDC058499 TaxID=3346530 RepID=UPI0036612E84